MERCTPGQGKKDGGVAERENAIKRITRSQVDRILRWADLSVSARNVKLALQGFFFFSSVEVCVKNYCVSKIEFENYTDLACFDNGLKIKKYLRTKISMQKLNKKGENLEKFFNRKDNKDNKNFEWDLNKRIVWWF